MPRIHSNNYTTTLTAAIADSDLTMTVASVAALPTIGAGVTCNLTLVNPLDNTLEIVTATSNSSTTITITRASEGTSALAFPSGATVSLRPTANSIDRKADGASSATDNALPRFDGTTGKVLQGSSVIVDDSNNVTGVVGLSSTTVTASSKVTVGGNSTAAGNIEFLEDSDNGSNKIILTAPATIASDKTITFPDTTGTLALAADLPNSFATIAVSGQSDVVADSTTDTLTLVAGTNVTITTNAGSDSITIAASGGGGGGGWTYIGSAAPGTAITSGITGYDCFVIVGTGFVNSGGGANFRLQLSVDGGATYPSSWTQSIIIANTQSTTLTIYDTTSIGTGYLAIGAPGGTGSGTYSFDFVCYLNNLTSTSLHKSVRGESNGWDNSGPNAWQTRFLGAFANTSAVNAIKVYENSGSTTGTYRLYGIPNS